MTNQTDFDSLLDTDMDDIADLPPVGVPPTGHYNLLVSASREKNDNGGEYIAFKYKVEAVNEVKEEAEADQAVAGMQFTEFFSPVKKDGTRNDLGLGYLKQSLAPFKEHFGTGSLGETLANVKDVVVAATVVRVRDKKDKERFNARISDVVVL